MPQAIRITCMLLLTAGVKAQAPSATIVPLASSYCSSTSVTFSSSVNGGPVTYSWSVFPRNGVIFLTATDQPSVDMSFNVPVTHTLSLLVSSGSLSAYTAITFSVSRRAIASFNASLTSAGFPAELVLTNYSSNTTKSYWKFSDSQLADSSFHTVRSFSSPGTYTVSLVALGRNGCRDSSAYSFVIPGTSSIELPNVFTPNGDDVNDVYRPIAQGISAIKAYVYNRDGVLLSSWDRANGSWDGYTTSGMACDAGVYFITVEATGFDGTLHRKKTAFTLIR
jgi:gliding motility-associated-like protein